MKRANALFLTRERRVNEKIRLRNRFTVVSRVNRAGLDFTSRFSGTWITVRPFTRLRTVFPKTIWNFSGWIIRNPLVKNVESETVRSWSGIQKQKLFFNLSANGTAEIVLIKVKTESCPVESGICPVKTDKSGIKPIQSEVDLEFKTRNLFN